MQAPPKLDHDNFPSLAMNQSPMPSPPGAQASELAPALDGPADGRILSSSSSGSMEGSAEASPSAADSKPARGSQEGPAAWGGAAAARSERCLWGFCCQQSLSGTHTDTGKFSNLLPSGCTPGQCGGNVWNSRACGRLLFLEVMPCCLMWRCRPSGGTAGRL